MCVKQKNIIVVIVINIFFSDIGKNNSRNQIPTYYEKTKFYLINDLPLSIGRSVT